MSSPKTLLTIVVLAMLLAPGIAQRPAEAATQPLLGQVQAFGFNFAPRGWAKCDGQLLAISRNSALFSLLGTMYGGDGRTTFGLPDLRGRVAVHPGRGPGLTSIRQGAKFGRETVTLTSANLPSHAHPATLMLPVAGGNQKLPPGLALAMDPSKVHYSDKAPPVTMKPAAIGIKPGNAGGGKSFNIRNPSLGLLHCIALQGTFPSRS